jgi:hypothetical protein
MMQSKRKRFPLFGQGKKAGGFAPSTAVAQHRQRRRRAICD